MDEDDAILLIIGDENEANETFPEDSSTIQIKLESKEEPDEFKYSDLDPKSILESAELHGEYISLKEEEENWDCDYLEIHEGMDREHKGGKNKIEEESSESSTDDDEYLKTHPRPQHSYIAQLCKNFPKMRKDEEFLVGHLTEIMKHTKPPIPPIEFCENVNGKLVCAYCNAESTTLPIATRHYQKKHGTRYLTCYACGVDYRCTTGLYKHEKRCTAAGARLVLKARGRYLGRKGRRRPYLTLNKFQPNDLKNEPDKRLYCTHCTASFKHKDALVSHENMHRGIRPYQCDQCPVAYTSAIALKRHLVTHSDAQHICDVCGRSFKAKTTLIVHMNTHLPQRKYPCERCERRFAQKSALQHHVNRDHLNIPPPFACAACPKRFPRMSNLKQHMKAKHGLTLMSRKMFFKALPSMKEKELQQATIVFNNYENDVITAPLGPTIFNKKNNASSVDDDISSKSEDEDTVQTDPHKPYSSLVKTNIKYFEKKPTEILATENGQESIENQLERILGTNEEHENHDIDTSRLEEILGTNDEGDNVDSSQLKVILANNNEEQEDEVTTNTAVIQTSLQDGCELEFVKFISQKEDEKKSKSRIPRIDLRILQMHKNVQTHTRGRDMPGLINDNNKMKINTKNADEMITDMRKKINKSVEIKMNDKKVIEGPMKMRANKVRREPVQTRSGVMKTRSGAIKKNDAKVNI